MFFSLFFFSSRVKQNAIFLPPALSSSSPYAYSATFDEKNLVFSKNNSDFFKISKVNHENSSTTVTIIVTHAEQNVVTSNIDFFTEDNFSNSFQITISPVYSVYLKATSNNLFVNQSIEFLTIYFQDSNKNCFDFLPDYLLKFNYNETALTIDRSSSNATLPNFSYYLIGREKGKYYVSVSVSDIFSRAVKIHVVDHIYAMSSEMYIPLHATSVPINLCATNFINETCSQEYDTSIFNFIVEDQSIATYYKGIKPLKIGETNIRIQYSQLEHNYINMHIHVVDVAYGKGETQWLTIGQTPSFKDYSLFDSLNNSCWKPDWRQLVIGQYDQNSEGVQFINATIYNISFTYEIHFCAKVHSLLNSARMPIGHGGFKFNIEGGSGQVSYEVENTSVAIVVDENTITAIAPGKTQVFITDKLTKYRTVTKVKVEDILSARFNMSRFEMRIGEKLNISYFGLGMSGKKFTYFEPDRIYSTNTSVINTNFECVGPGFARIQMTCGDSNATELFSVIDKLSIVHGIKGLVKEKFDLQIKGGPQHWEDAEPPVYKVTCDNSTTIIKDGIISFNETYKGTCTLVVANDPTENNPTPLIDSQTFDVDVIKVAKTAIIVSGDEHAIGCGIPRKFEQNEASSFIWKSRIYIPDFVIPTLTLYLFDDKLNEIGVYNDARISALLENGSTITAPLSSPIHEKITFSFSHEFLPSSSIIIEPYSNITVPHELILMKDCDDIDEIIRSHIHGGSKHYEIISREEGIIVVQDKCVPEFRGVIKVNYSKPKKLAIIGKQQCAVGKEINLSLALFNEAGIKFNSNSLKCCSPTFNGVPSNGTFSFNATRKGTFNVTATACGLEATHSVYVFEKLKAKHTYITAFPDQHISIEFMSVPSQVTYHSENTTIITDELYAISPGTTHITASIEGRPEFGSVNITVTVLNVSRIVIKPSVLGFIVNSYAVFRAYATTETEEIELPYVNWSADFPITVVALNAHAFFRKPGNYCIRAKFNGIHGSYEFMVDTKLEVERKITIPIGTTHIIKSNGVCHPNTFYGSEEGVFNVMCQRNLQRENVTVVVKKPTTLRLQQDGKYIKTTLLDEYGQQFSPYNGTKFYVNVTSKATKGMFLIEPQTDILVAEYSQQFNVSAVGYVTESFFAYEKKVLKGFKGKLSCSSPQEWESSNSHIKINSESGFFAAVSTGTSTVKCSDHNKAKITVTSLDGVEVDNRSDVARIKPMFKGTNEETGKLLDSIKCVCGSSKCMQFESYFACTSNVTNLHVSYNNIRAPELWINNPINDSLLETEHERKQTETIDVFSIIQKKFQSFLGFRQEVNE